MSNERKNDGGRAFPVCIPRDFIEVSPGMSLRDYFAAKAMSGELASILVQEEDSAMGLPLSVSDENLNECARHWYRIADAMLKAREQ